MTTATEAIKTALQTHLENALITAIPEDDPARADVVKIGPLQGDPEIEDAPLSVEIYQNDPEDLEEWWDEIIEWEMPRTAIWSRKFSIQWRALLTELGEPLAEAVAIVSTLKSRLEIALNTMCWTDIEADGEFIDGCSLEEMESRIDQGGGPNEYDYSGKIRFAVLTRAPYT